MHRHQTFHSFNATVQNYGMDVVIYKLSGGFKYGIVDTIVQTQKPKITFFFITRRLVQVDPERRNRIVVESYGHKRFAYQF